MFEYGDRVKITVKYVRKIFGSSRVWEEKAFEAEGIYLGERTIASGVVYNTRGRLGEIVSYKNVLLQKAALVSPGPDRNPIRVPYNKCFKLDKI